MVDYLVTRGGDVHDRETGALCGTITRGYVGWDIQRREVARHPRRYVVARAVHQAWEARPRETVGDRVLREVGAVDRTAGLERLAERYAAALIRYGEHEAECDRVCGCTCGFNAETKELAMERGRLSASTGEGEG